MKSILMILTNLEIITWWLTPFIFVASLVKAIALEIKNEKNIRYIIIASISLILILAPFIYDLIYF